MTGKEPFQPKYRQIYRKLMTEIRTGRYNRSGLPGERALSESFSCCRTTIRRALKALRQNGILATHHGKRTQISSLAVRGLRFLWLTHTELSRLSPARLNAYETLMEKLRENSASLVYWRLHNQKEDTWLMEHLSEYDGIIFSDVHTEKLSPFIVEKLSRFRKKVTLDSSDNQKVRNTVVCTDEYVTGRMAAEFLHRCGMERIALLGISHNLKAQYFQERVNGFINYWMENGSGAPHELHLTLSREMDAFCAAPTAFLEKLHLRENRVQAIFLITDLTAIVCLEALKKMGFRIPEDISVMGCDNLAESAATEPPLTTMAHPTDKIVNSIWEILISNLGLSQHPVNEGSTTFPPQLIQRGSVRPRS